MDRRPSRGGRVPCHAKKSPQRHASPFRKGLFTFSAGCVDAAKGVKGLRFPFQPGAHFLRWGQFAGIFRVKGDPLEVVANAQTH